MRTNARKPTLRGSRTHDETSAIWELAEEGRSPSDIAEIFKLGTDGAATIYHWQRDNGIEQVAPGSGCGCTKKKRSTRERQAR